MAKRDRRRHETPGGNPGGLPDDLQEFMVACYDLYARLGAAEVQLRYDEEQDPIVWVVAVHLRPAAAGGNPNAWQAGGSLTPDGALYDVLEKLVDGGTCTCCGRPSSVERDWSAPSLAPSLICTYQYDPELGTFRRSCEGETP